MSLAETGYAPSIFAYIDKSCCPLWALVFMLLFGPLAYINLSANGPLVFIFFLVNPIYRAKMVIYVTRSIGCGDLRSGQIISCYCPNSCWDSGDCSLTLCSCGACKKDFRQRL